MLPLSGAAGGSHDRRHHHGMDGNVAETDDATHEKLSQHVPFAKSDQALSCAATPFDPDGFRYFTVMPRFDLVSLKTMSIA